MITDKLEGEHLYLIDVGNPYIGFMEIPIKEDTIKEYEVWASKTTKGFIALVDNFPPQELYHSSIKHAISIKELIEIELENYDLGIADITVPFIGGVTQDDFKKLLISLFQTERLDYWEAQSVIKQHYHSLFVELEKERKNARAKQS